MKPRLLRGIRRDGAIGRQGAGHGSAGFVTRLPWLVGVREKVFGGSWGMKSAFLAACLLAIFLSGYPYNLMGVAMLGVSVLVECFVALTRPPL